jgi:hypothetical protein
MSYPYLFTPIDVAFDANDFSASGSLSWDVQSSEVVTHQFVMLNPNLMLFTFNVQASSLSGTAAQQLIITLPNGKKAVREVSVPCLIVSNGVQGEVGRMGTTVGGTSLRIYRQDPTATWPTGSNNWVSGQIVVEVE